MNNKLKYKLKLLMLLPTVLYVFIFNYLPMPGILLAFKKFSYTQGIFKSPRNGFENFRFFFVSGDAARVTLNTFSYNLVFMVLEVSLAVLVAILFNELCFKRFNKTTQTIMFYPILSLGSW